MVQDTLTASPQKDAGATTTTSTTPLPDLDETRAVLQSTYTTGANVTYEWRAFQLRNLQRLVHQYEARILQALHDDLGRHAVESHLAELQLVYAELDGALKHLKTWMRPVQVSSPGLALPCFSRLERRPLRGPAVLILAPFNYPYSLAILPLIGALAGGNCAVIKPSELCPATAALLADLLSHMDGTAVRCILGAVPETTQLLQQAWGKILFTGSERVGTIVAQAAAKTLTPVILELGGKSPVVIDVDAPADMRAIANRIVWGKTFNAGQTCIAPDYVLVHVSHKARLLRELEASLKLQFDGATYHEYGKMVTVEHAQRQLNMIKQVEEYAAKSDSTTHTLLGGSTHCRVQDRHIAPTIVVDPPMHATMIKEEIFGPILPILTYTTRQECYEMLQAMPPTPLALYVFTTSAAVFDEYCTVCPSGGAIRNDVMLHYANLALPFGGLGASGYGNYHGKHSFAAFTHELPVMYRPCAPGMDFNMLRCHPYRQFKGHVMVNVLMKLPSIPVLHLRAVAGSASLLLAAWYVPALRPFTVRLMHELAGALHRLAAWLLEQQA